MHVLLLLTLIVGTGWIVLELIESSRVGRILAGAVAIAFAAGAGYYVGGFAEWNKHRFYPIALIEIAKQLRQGEAAKVEAAIAQVFESGGNPNEATSLELMQALNSTSATGGPQ